jgi:DNA invertase Pin-like site-specific DNA recombinase
VLALKKQIAAAGHVLVHEYVDDGFPGPLLARPALDQLRKDLKTDQFDIVYFHAADRIAREVTIQNIIVEEILKNRKRLVIAGKDCERDPENKLALTIFGAVAEFERAKIIERVTRGKQLRLSQGQLIGCGVHTFGYDYERKTPTSPPRMIVNEREAAIVRHVFEVYAAGRISMDKIAQELEDSRALTKKGNSLWRRSFLKVMLSNETYLGVKYFNTMRCVREYANPIYGIKYSTKKQFRRDRNEWIGIEIPAIISRELFDRVQERRAQNRKTYRNPRRTALLSCLVKCGACGHSSFAYHRWVRSKRKGPVCVIHGVSYKCGWNHLGRLHSRASKVERCHNPEVKGALVEGRVLAMIRETMLHPAKLRACMDYFREDAGAAGHRIEAELRAVHGRLEAFQAQKRRIIEVYASGDLSRDGYVEKSRELDGMIETLEARRRELADSAALLRSSAQIDAGIGQFCEAARVRFARCRDFADTRQFFLDYVEKVVHLKDKVSLHGSVPIKSGHGDAAETNKLAFCIESEITLEERYAERMRTAQEMLYQQSIAALHKQSADASHKSR